MLAFLDDSLLAVISGGIGIIAICRLFARVSSSRSARSRGFYGAQLYYGTHNISHVFEVADRLARSPEAGAAAGFSVIFLIFALATPDTFLSHSAISSILNSQAVPGILAWDRVFPKIF